MHHRAPRADGDEGMTPPRSVRFVNEHHVVRDRHGSVLSHGLVLKDRVAPGMVHLQGAPCFRGASSEVGVYGLAQPSIGGLKTVLTFLQCQPRARADAPMRCVWVCTREEPVIYVGDRAFVLRELERPTHALGLSDRAANLEAIEQRLKQDILDEASRGGDLLLVHEEQEESHELVPTWVAVQHADIRTLREVWTGLQQEGWHVDYHRLPISPEQPLEHNYLDAYTQVIKDADPRKTCFVANCGAGVSRTTFAMIAAVIVRSRQLTLLADAEPPRRAAGEEGAEAARAPPQQLASSLRRMQASVAQSQSMLGLMHVLTEALSKRATTTTLAELQTRPALLESLRLANMGEYSVVRQLLGLLDDGRAAKAVVDAAVDACQTMVNLRESVLENRLRFSSAATEDASARAFLQRAGRALEVYYFLIVFARYVQESPSTVFQRRFVDWLKQSEEIWRGIQRVRTLRQHLSLFDPVADLSMISHGSTARLPQSTPQGAVTGDEFAEFVVHNRSGSVLHSGLLLKRDIWREFVQEGTIPGTVNFRRIPGTNVFGTGQPTVLGIHNLLTSILDQMPKTASRPKVITWINLREEPLVYVAGNPYCLRQRELSLRNIKDYSGITPTRLQQIEDRLRNDVVAELRQGDGKLLLHTETDEGKVVPVWEDASPSDIATVQEVMDAAAHALPGNAQLVFQRVPITAEKSVDAQDVMELLKTVLAVYEKDAPIIVNCQLGRGRTTLAAVLILLITRWVKQAQGEAPVPTPEKRTRVSYHLTNSLLRLVPHGKLVKSVVDECIDQCNALVDLRGAIEDARLAAEEAATDAERRAHIAHGVQALDRYFHLLLFQAYLGTVTLDTILTHTFAQFIERQPVLATLGKELQKGTLATIMPLHKMDVGDGMALDDEVLDVVQNRSGNVLGPQTILKSDFFSGILKAGLPLRVEGMPNLRCVAPLVPLGAAPAAHEPDLPTAQETWGCGMPTLDGLRRGLMRMGAAPGGTERLLWTNLREEPVLYVNGRPHVLRIADQPLVNVEATGVATDVVEGVEQSLRRELLQEASQRAGRVLLHDEVQTGHDGFDIIPVWETVHDEDVLTPRDVYKLVRSEGFRVDYARVAVTDEQAPVPHVFSQLQDRVQEAIELRAVTVFNCQMGRGRTTSGMIIAALIVNVHQYGPVLLQHELQRRVVREHAQGETQCSGPLQEDERMLRGEYRSILQLVGVLSNGKFAKAFTDRVIDRMETIQNLRKAISLAKLRADSAEPDSPKHAKEHMVYHNYLARYGYLIAFTSYLLDKLSRAVNGESEEPDTTPGRSSHRPFPAFERWLEKRREIRTILERDGLD